MFCYNKQLQIELRTCIAYTFEQCSKGHPYNNMAAHIYYLEYVYSHLDMYIIFHMMAVLLEILIISCDMQI